MATLAHRHVMRSRVLRTVGLVRIVARKASHLARPETRRHTQSIPGLCDLETIPLTRRTVEEELVLAHRLTRPVGIDTAVVPANLIWHQAAAGLQMALHADFQLPIPAETRRIDDRLPDLLPRSVGRESGTHVGAPRPMTPLAINPLRYWVGEKRKARIAALWITPLQRQPVVAEQALAGDRPAEILLPRAIVARAHRPVAGILHIPRHRQFDQPAIRATVQVTVGMVAGSNDVVDLFLDDVGLLAVETLLRPALVKLAVALDHRVRQARSVVVNRVMSWVVLNRIRRGWPIQGTTHAGELVSPGNILMATGADRRVHIAGALLGNRNRPRLRDNLPGSSQQGNAA